jgi:periplasmic protein TonB
MNPFTQNSREGFDEIVFEKRNKIYGAYALRQNYNSRINLSFGLVVSAMMLVFMLHHILAHQENTFSMPKAIPDLLPYDPPVFEKPETPQKPKPDHHAGGGQIKTQASNLTKLLVPVLNTDTIDQIDLDQLNREKIKEGDSGNPFTGKELNNGQGMNGSGGSGTIGGDGQDYVETPDYMPEFPGGETAFFRYLTHAMRFPRNESASSVVFVSFIIDAGGKVGKIDILKSGGHSFDQEVKRVISGMPDWKPGKMHGKKVAVRFKIPVKFTRGDS